MGYQIRYLKQLTMSRGYLEERSVFGIQETVWALKVVVSSQRGYFEEYFGVRV
jgi:hypothetical protein